MPPGPRKARADDDLRIEPGARRFGFAASKKFCWSRGSKLNWRRANGQSRRQGGPAIVAKLWLGTLAAVTVAGRSNTSTTAVPSNIVQLGGVHTHRARVPMKNPADAFGRSNRPRIGKTMILCAIMAQVGIQLGMKQAASSAPKKS